MGGFLKNLCIPVLAFLVFPFFPVYLCTCTGCGVFLFATWTTAHLHTIIQSAPVVVIFLLSRSLYHLDPILVKSVSPFSTVNFSLDHSDMILIILLQFWLFPKVSSRYKQLLRSTLAFCPNQNRNIYMRNILTKTINHKKNTVISIIETATNPTTHFWNSFGLFDM